MQYSEKSPIESGFAEVFDRDIAPKLTMLEDRRRTLNNQGWMYFAGAMAVFAIFAFLISFSHGGFGAFVLLAMGAVLGFALRSWKARKWSGAVAEEVMPTVCDFLGDVRYSRDATSLFPLWQVEALGLVSRYDNADLEDHLSGTWQGVGYEMVEARLTRRSRDSKGKSSNTTVFRGLLFRIALPNPAPTRILIARNYGRAINALASFFSFGSGRGMPRVETGHLAFEEDFELHAAHPDGVLDYLPPAFLDNLVDIGALESERGTKGMRAAFDGSDFWLALERHKPFMEMARLSQPVHEIRGELHQVFDDMALIRRIIERLQA